MLTAPNDRVLFPGTVIPASLVTDLNSESPGPIIAQATQTICDSATGRIALIFTGHATDGRVQILQPLRSEPCRDHLVAVDHAEWR